MYFTDVVINAGSFYKKFTTDDIKILKNFTGELKKYDSKSLTGKPYRTQNISKEHDQIKPNLINKLTN